MTEWHLHRKIQREEVKGNGTSRRQQWELNGTRNSSGRCTSIHVLFCEPCKTGGLSVGLWQRLCSAYEVAVKSEEISDFPTRRWKPDVSWLLVESTSVRAVREEFCKWHRWQSFRLCTCVEAKIPTETGFSVVKMKECSNHGLLTGNMW